MSTYGRAIQHGTGTAKTCGICRAATDGEQMVKFPHGTVATVCPKCYTRLAAMAAAPPDGEALSRAYGYGVRHYHGD